MFQVQATDDDKTGPNAQITYSIVSQGNKFNIDPNEGWLTTNAVSFFYRDFLDRLQWEIVEKLNYCTSSSSFSSIAHHRSQEGIENLSTFSPLKNLSFETDLELQLQTCQSDENLFLIFILYITA